MVRPVSAACTTVAISALILTIKSSVVITFIDSNSKQFSMLLIPPYLAVGLALAQHINKI